MNFSEKIKKAYNQAMSEKASYPRLAKLLNEAGVKFYIVDVKTSNVTYYGKEEHFQKGEDDREINSQFNKEKIIKSLRDSQSKKITYMQFLDGISEAGVQTYLADLENKKVTYIGHGQAYAEAISNI